MANEPEEIVVVPRPGKRRLNAIISVKFSPEDLDIIHEANGDANIISFIHDATIKVARESSSERG